jgi:hypothetical protein
MPFSVSFANHTASSLSVFGRPGTFFTSLALTSQHESPRDSSRKNQGFQYTDVASMTTRRTLSVASRSASSRIAPVVAGTVITCWVRRPARVS